MGTTTVVQRLQDCVNAGDVDALLELFAADASVTIPALSPKTGPAEIRSLFEFCAGISVRWDFKESLETDGGVECSVDQFDGWARVMGVAPLHYESFRITIEDGLITAIEGAWSPTTMASLGKVVEGFTPWAVDHHAELFGDDGDFLYSREAGHGFIAAAEEWVSSRPTGRR